MYGSGFSAVCPSASIGCAFGLCQAAAPLVAESLCSHFGRCDRRLRSGMAADCGGVLCVADCIPADRRIILYEILAMNVPPMKRDISGPTERLLDLPQKLQFRYISTVLLQLPYPFWFYSTRIEKNEK